MRTKLSLPRRGLHRLTPREIGVIKLIAAGLGTKEIASKLGISEHTIESHRSTILHKLDLRRATQLVRWAIEEGIA